MKRAWVALAIVAVASGSIYASGRLSPHSYGRLEVVEIAVATKTSGRIAKILVDESDSVSAGQVVAYTGNLQARHREAEVQLQRAILGVSTAQTLLTQREAERVAAVAGVEEHEALLEIAVRRLARIEPLVGRKYFVRSVMLPDDRRDAGRQARAPR